MRPRLQFSIVLTCLLTAGLIAACAGAEAADPDSGAEPLIAEVVSEAPAQQVALEPTVIPRSAYEGYCSDLGYAYEHRFTVTNCDEYFACVFPDGSECPAEDLVAGKCGSEFSYCAKQGGELESGAIVGQCKLPGDKTCSEMDFWQGLCGGD